MNTLDINEKMKVAYCISTELRDEQIKINLSKVKDRVTLSNIKHSEPIAIVSFGPSLNDTWEELKKFKYIMTCSGAHKFLVEKGIIPTWHLDLDPREYKYKMIGEPQAETEYLIASTIHPRYLDYLKDHNAKIKLWHIYASDDEAVRVIPKGELQLLGGSSVGLRCLSMAAVLGFSDFHIFGMDGSFRDGATHTTEHVNAPKEFFETEYAGKRYMTTPSILHVAKETFHELDQLKGAKATFYGEGLIQAMAKDYVPKYKNTLGFAIEAQELISKEYVELNRKLHQDNPSYGMGGAKHADTVIKLTKSLINPENQFVRVLDYGAGKGMLAKSLPFSIDQYDPAIPEISQIPAPADLVVASDVLEHIEPERLNYVLEDIKRCVKQIGYFVISTRKAIKTYANGKNAHLIVKGKDWWEPKLAKYFEIGTIIEKEKEAELHIIVAPKKVIQLDITTVEKDNKKFQFYTPNDTTKWRANSLFTKEPSTIKWIEEMKENDTLYDIGANIGSYSIFAGVKRVKVYAFEPEAGNYSVLVRNFALNEIEPHAYCIALSDEEKLGTLYAGQAEVGGACHSFNEQVGFDLQFRESKFTQGCYGTTLDNLIDKGLPFPQHIKIDVDGFEYKVIKGAEKTLKKGVESLLIEVNTSLPEHVIMVDYLDSLGYTFDEKQVEKARRKEGTFKGVAEYIFRKEYVKKEVGIIDNIYNTAMDLEPYNYLYTKNVFKEKDYKEMLANMPTNYVEIEKSRGTRGYPKRFTSNPLEDSNENTVKIWKGVYDKLLDGKLKNLFIDRFGLPNREYKEELLLVRDEPGYHITPHTDTISKVVTALFYLPEDESMLEEGTTVFIPKEKEFICKTGRHYDFESFNVVETLPFKPNSMFTFARTDNSFHGVFPSKHVRNVLLYILKTN